VTEPGTTGGLAPEPASETADTSVPAELPTRRSLREQRDALANAADAQANAAAADTSMDGTPAASTGEDATPSTGAVAVRPIVVPAVPVIPAGPFSVKATDSATDAAASVPSTHHAARRAASAPRAIAPVAAAKPVQRTGPSKKRSLGLIAALFVVPGVFLTVSLPAYAFSPGSTDAQFAESGSHKIAQAGAQSVDVSSAAAKITVSRDGYTAVSGEEIRAATAKAAKAAQAQAAAEAAAKSGGYSTPAQRQEGDDYPWPSGPVGVLSPLNYEYRECVDFVAWRLNRDAGATGPWRWVWSNLTPGGGSAWNWANAWYANGWQVSHDPIVGSVAWFTGNHVAYVQSVNGDGTVTIEEYNQNSDHNYHRRTIPVGGAALYLYPPPA
jgi:surface antigen